MKEPSGIIQQTAGRGIPVRGNDIDTDQIIPARFMKVVSFEGLGEYAFYDQRFTEQGAPKDHPFNDNRFKGASVLLANRNFGCGSSREHAPQALMRFGIRAIIAESYAEIFQGNCTALGIPALTLSSRDVRVLMDVVEDSPESVIGIDLEDKRVMCGDLEFSCDLPESYRNALTAGTWDSTSVLLDQLDQIREAHSRIPCFITHQE